jgi:regulator of protease activity HflC (stomatin/prohibitin superfamily)
MTNTLIALLVAAIGALYVRARLRKVTVFEYERGLLYAAGKFRGVLEPGEYRLWTPSRTVVKVDVRPRIAAVPGQEVLTADGIAVKVSLVAQYRIADPVTAVNAQASYESALYTELPLAIRRLISAESIDSLLEKRPGMAAQLTDATKPSAARLGLDLIQADVKDLTLPGELKKLFTQVTRARQEGLAALERARGETAALRNLANAAWLVSDNPALMQLRLLQVVGEQSGNTVVLGMPSSAAPLPIPQPPRDRIQSPPAVEPPDA